MTDTLKTARRLRAAGMPEAQAEVIANELWEMQRTPPAPACPRESWYLRAMSAQPLLVGLATGGLIALFLGGVLFPLIDHLRHTCN
jgi:hypothetical protein